MTFLIDAQLPPHLKQWLRDVGAEDATHVGDHPGGLNLSDPNIWELAKNESSIMVTKDMDFLAISNIYGSPPQVVILRYGNCSNQTLLSYLSVAWKETAVRLSHKDTRLIVLMRDRLEVYRQ